MLEPLFQLDSVLNRKLYLSLQKAYFRQFRQGYRKAWMAAALALAAVAGLLPAPGTAWAGFMPFWLCWLFMRPNGAGICLRCGT